MFRASLNAMAGSTASATLGPLALVAIAFAVGCGDDTSGSTSETGGSNSSGGSSASSTGGSADTGGNSSTSGTSVPTGGTATGGTATGGVATGGQATGGVATGGTAGGGVATGGTATGGSTTGGASTGGRANGGRSFGGTGGRAAGGANTGGANTGGASTGGASTGDAGAGGAGQGGASTGGSGAGGAADVAPSEGCGKTPTLKNSTTNSNPSPITINVSGTNREYALRYPSDYDSAHPYRLILDLHGYGGTYKETAGEDYFGLWSVSNNTTVFIALSAIDTDWRNGDNLAYVDAVLEAVQADLCIDTSRIMLEGFSQGAAEAWQLACSRPGVFRAAVGHSGGGVTNPSSCEPIPYLGSGGLQENVTQTTQTDQFAKWNGCTVATLPKAPSGGHVCTDYAGCPAEAPVRWCNYDGPHTPLPTDSGERSSWMPSETWPFFTQF